MPRSTQSSPSPDLFPIDELNRFIRKVIREIPKHSVSYDHPPGSELLRRQLARWARHAGVVLSPREFLITNGAFEAIAISLRAVANPGDTIAVESPTHFCILQTIESLGMKALEISTHPQLGLDLESLKWALRHYPVRAGIFMPNFNNPMGSLMTDSAKQELVEIFSERGLPIIEDDVSGDLNHSGNRPKSLKAFDRHGLVLWCSSFSKTLSLGLRVGWVTPGKFREQAEKLKFAYSMGSPNLAELVISKYLESGRFERQLRHLREVCRIQISRFREAVCKYFPLATRASNPKGGFVLWIKLPRILSALKFYRIAVEHKIGIAPGAVFSPSNRFSNYIRLNCGNTWTDQIEASLQTLGKIAHGLLKPPGHDKK